ncbi:MAG: alpha/beta hydrolase [Dehalococcoidia bacterium]|nr:alpha/beta hydrolase [Dehalococcoidia bacterium]
MQSDFVSIPGLRMHYLQEGTGEPVIFIHGFPETSYEWRYQMPHLAGQGFATFAPDVRGFGKTDKPGARMSRSLLASDLIAFMDAKGIEKATVVGHDWGGIIAFKVAIDWPERVTRLALLDTLCTVWAPGAIHGYWFKAEPYPEEFFAKHHSDFIRAIFAGDTELPPRPLSPWQIPAGILPRWADDECVDHYVEAFRDPMSQFHAISQYRYALPFHVVHEDASIAGGERYEALSERQVAEMWLHPEGLEKHPRFENYMDYGPEDRARRFEKPTLWMYGSYLGRSPSGEAPTTATTDVPKGNPFVDQFSRYFPDLRGQHVDAGHFFPEEAPDVTNRTLLAFLKGDLDRKQ